MGNLSLRDIVIYHKGLNPPRFDNLEDRTKEAPWGDTCKIRVWGQEESLEADEDLPTLTKSPPQIPTKLEEVDKDAVRFQSHEGVHGQAVVDQRYFGTVQEVDPGLAPQDEPLLFQIPPQTIQ